MSFNKSLAISALTILLLMGSAKTQAQLYNRTYIEDRPTMLFSSIVPRGDSFEVIGVVSNKQAPYYQRIIIGELNSSADLSSYVSLYDSSSKDYAAFFNSAFVNDREELLYAGYSHDSIQRLLTLKKTSDSIILSEYDTVNTYAFQGFKMIQHQSNYYVTGVHSTITPANGDIFLMKTDSVGSKIWLKYYGVQNQLEYAKSLIKLKNGNLMLGGVRDDLNQTHAHAHTWLLEVDTNGMIVRQWLDPNDSTYAAEALIQTADGFYYTAAKKYSESGGSIARNGTIVKLDSAFNKQWTFKDGYRSIDCGISDLILLPDESLLACGQRPIYFNDSSILSGWILKLTSDGQVLWNKEYTASLVFETRNFLSDIDTLANGHIIAVGQTQIPNQQPTQMGWLLKLDSNGCEIENCVIGIDEKFEDQLTQIANLYPNPANTSVTVEHSSLKAGCIIEVIDFFGRVQTSKKLDVDTDKATVDVATLTNGVYFLRLCSTSAKSTGKFTILR